MGLLVRRHRRAAERAYHHCYSPAPVPLSHCSPELTGASLLTERGASGDHTTAHAAWQHALHILSAYSRGWFSLRSVGSANIVKDGLALLIHKSGEQLLRVPEDQGPGEDLRGCVQRAETRDELATHEEQAEKSRDCTGRKLEGGKGHGQTIPFG